MPSSRNLKGIRIVRRSFNARAAAEHDVSRDAETVSWMAPLVVEVAAHVRGAGGMIHQKNAIAVNAEFAGISARPGDDLGHVFRRTGIFGVAPEAIADIDADDTVAAE